jgi:hypothetical protein
MLIGHGYRSTTSDCLAVGNNQIIREVSPVFRTNQKTNDDLEKETNSNGYTIDNNDVPRRNPSVYSRHSLRENRERENDWWI